MGVEENKAAVRRFVKEFLNERNVAVVDEIFAEDLVDHQGARAATGDRESVKQFAAAFLDAFPDLRLQIDSLVAEGDTVSVLVTSQGTHQGEFNGVPPTGRSVTIAGVSIMRFANGRVIERWNVTDVAGLMAQIT